MILPWATVRPEKKTASNRLAFGRLSVYDLSMSRVEEIRASIEKLTLEERVELAGLLAGEFPDDDWDQQMKAAACAGKFDDLNAKADAAVRDGRCTPLDSCPSE